MQRPPDLAERVARIEGDDGDARRSRSGNGRRSDGSAAPPPPPAIAAGFLALVLIFTG